MLSDCLVGTNVTNSIGIRKFYDVSDPEGPEYVSQCEKRKLSSKGSPSYLMPFPDFLVKTDQPRLQANLGMIQGVDKTRTFSASIKYDGQSIQWFHYNGRNGVCSRNYQLDLDAEDKTNVVIKTILRKYDIFTKLQSLGRNLSVQTEMYGMSINGNRHQLKHVDIATFDIYDIDAKKFLSHAEVVAITDKLQLPMVGVLFEKQPLLSENIADWIQLADSQKYSDGLPAEGIVVRTDDDAYPYISFKVISPKYLTKYSL